MSRANAVFLVLLSALGFGSIAFFAKVAYVSGASPSALLALRFFLAVLMLAPLVWFKRLPLPRGGVLAGYVVMGMLYTAQAQSYFNALLYASSGLVALLLYIYPVLVTLLAVLLGWEKADKRSLILTTIACLGLAITLGGKLEGRPAGIALGILAAAIYAVYILLGTKLSRDTHPLSASLVILATAAAGNTGIALLGGATLPGNTVGWIAVGAIALFSTGMAIAFFLVGVKVIGASQASILSTLEPVLTLTIGVLLLGEHVSGTQLFGGAMVLIAVSLLAQRPAVEPVKVESEPEAVPLEQDTVIS